MRGEARLLCALGLVLLCTAAHFQGAYCSGGGGGGHGGGGGGQGGGHGGGGGGHGGGGGGHGSGGGGGHSGGEVSGGGGAHPITYGPGTGALAGRTTSGSHGYSAASEPHGRTAWTVSGAAATLATAALVRWL